ETVKPELAAALVTSKVAKHAPPKHVSPGMQPPQEPPQLSSPHTLPPQTGLQNPASTEAWPMLVAFVIVTVAELPVSATEVSALPWCRNVPSEANDLTVTIRLAPTGTFSAL